MRLIDCTLDPSQRKLPSCQRLVWIWHWQYGPKLQRFPLIVSLLHWQKTLDCCRLVKYSIVLVYLVRLREFYGRQTLECELKAFKNILVPKISCITAGYNYISSLGVVDCLYSNFCSTLSLYSSFKLHVEYIVPTVQTQFYSHFLLNTPLLVFVLGRWYRPPNYYFWNSIGYIKCFKNILLFTFWLTRFLLN